MQKIRDKSQELVSSAIPHVLSTQQSAINLVQLKHNIELMASVPELKMARQSYVDIRALVSDSELSKHPALKDASDNILLEVNRLWKLRLQLDELRSSVNSSLYFMDTLLYLIYNDYPALFPEIDKHTSNYIDIYQLSYYTRDLKAEHLYYYELMKERLAESFNQEEFILANSSKAKQLDKRNNNSNSVESLSSAVDNALKSSIINRVDKDNANPIIDDNSIISLGNNALNIDASNASELKSFNVKHNLERLNLYKKEYDRFSEVWDLYIKLQHVFSYDVAVALASIDKLSHSFTSGETLSLHAELSDISYLASETQPMVMLTIAFCCVGFWAVIFLINHFLMLPLKNIARILIRFRHTKNLNIQFYDDFFHQDHLLEIREIIDILPHLFQDFSTIEEKTTALKMRYEELIVHSKYDDLTKIFNRGSLNLLIKEVGTSTPANFAVLMIDIDYFKHLNDSMGHQKGDEVLFAVAQTLQNNIAKKDMVFRYGGEEFCVILSDISIDDAYKVSQRLCQAIKKLKLINEGVPSNLVTVSIGVSLVTASIGQFRIDELISQADKALYLAKRNGRDRVVICPQELVFSIDEIEHVKNQAPKDNGINKFEPTEIVEVKDNNKIPSILIEEVAVEKEDKEEKKINEVEIDKQNNTKSETDENLEHGIVLTQMKEVLDEDTLNSLLANNVDNGIWNTDPLDNNSCNNLQSTFTPGLFDNNAFTKNEVKDQIYLQDQSGNIIAHSSDLEPKIEEKEIFNMHLKANDGFMMKYYDKGGTNTLANPKMLTIEDCINWFKKRFGSQASKVSNSIINTYEVLSGSHDQYKELDQELENNQKVKEQDKTSLIDDDKTKGLIDKEQNAELNIANTKKDDSLAQDAISQLVALKEVNMQNKDESKKK